MKAGDVTADVVKRARSQIILQVDGRKAERMLKGAFGWRKVAAMWLFRRADNLMGIGAWVLRLRIEKVKPSKRAKVCKDPTPG